MVDLRQRELHEWVIKNFGKETQTSEWQFMGMVEEVGELGHALLKMKQNIRDVTNEDIGDAFADIVIYGIQIMTCKGIDAEEALRRTISKVLKRDWKKYPINGETK